MIEKITTYCGFVAIVGRPNVGKSTLINQLLGQKVSITSCKPQTTRHPIRGIQTKWPYQAIYIDTPGLMQIKENRLINRVMNRVAINSLHDVAVILFVVEGTNWTRDDKIVVNRLRNVNSRVILVINKIDKIYCKKKLLPHIKFLNQQMTFHEIIPICAENGMNVNYLANSVHEVLPANEHNFLEDHITDRSQRFIASEIIREKIMRFLGDELPYSVAIEIQSFNKHNRGYYDIHAFIVVERDSQKKIVIGHKGNKIKMIGIKARKEMETMFEVIVHLQLWVKVKAGWADDAYALHKLGYIN